MCLPSVSGGISEDSLPSVWKNHKSIHYSSDGLLGSPHTDIQEGGSIHYSSDGPPEVYLNLNSRTKAHNKQEEIEDAWNEDFDKENEEIGQIEEKTYTS